MKKKWPGLVHQKQYRTSLVAVRTSRTITHKETFHPKEFKKTKKEQRKNEWTVKRVHGQFARDMEDKDNNNT